MRKYFICTIICIVCICNMRYVMANLSSENTRVIEENKDEIQTYRERIEIENEEGHDIIVVAVFTLHNPIAVGRGDMVLTFIAVQPYVKDIAVGLFSLDDALLGRYGPHGRSYEKE